MSKSKCACIDCECKVQEGQTYCSDECATGHKQGVGCGHDHCGCKGE